MPDTDQATLEELIDAPRAVEPRAEILKWFRFTDQTGRAREVARHYGLLAAATVLMCPPGEQRAVALQKLLEAKDAAVRSVLP
jgi:hypothetical protein